MQTEISKLNKYGFTPDDFRQIEKRNISLKDIGRQLDFFLKGTPFTKLNRSATTADSIKQLKSADFPRLLEKHYRAASGGRLIKFVPASGAASRMFRAMLILLNGSEKLDLDKLKKSASSGDKEAEFGVRFFENIADFAFYRTLKDTVAKSGLSFDEMLANGDLTGIMEFLLTAKGMNYAHLPKGLIEFHRYGASSRTPFQEHLFEGLAYVRDAEGKIRLHFTIIEEHTGKIKEHINSTIAAILEKDPAADFYISYSYQMKSTDTIAMELDNRPFRDTKGQLLFRPSGHGALINNLGDLNGDLVFINNIDNVRPQPKMSDTYLYKKLLCGYLIELQETVFEYLQDLEAGNLGRDRIEEIRSFTEEVLTTHVPDDFDGFPQPEKTAYLISRLDRPLRVCGMVKNLGDPGGGPFWVEDDNGEITLQIVESSQIDPDNPDQREILSASTHFNPVDLVCGLKDYKGRPFNLQEFIDLNAGFICLKSKDGRELKSLERPGLWNGAMAYWNTVFVEVPVSTFSPVKTVNDLLKNEHR